MNTPHNRIAIIGFVMFASATLCFSQKHTRYDVSTIPENLKKNAHAVIRENNVTFEYKTPERATLTERTAITILDEKGKQYANFIYPGDKYRTLINFTGAIYDNRNKQIRKLKKSEVRSSEWSPYLATGDIHYFLNIAPIEYPYTVEYEYQIEFKNGILMFPTFAPQQSAATSVQQSNYTLIVPENTRLAIKAFNTEPIRKIKTEKGTDIYFVEKNNIAALEPEIAMPDGSLFIPMVLMRPENFVYDKTPGQITDWNSLGVWQYNLWSGRQELDDAARQQIIAMTANASTNREKVKILYEHVGKTTHYQNISLGIGGFQPMPAAEVRRIGFGDCKGLTNYLHAMLKVVGIESNVTAIGASQYRKNVFADYANFTQFNHVILQVPLPADTLWLECTNTELPFGFVHNSIAGHQAVVFSAQGGKLVRLPDYPDSLSMDKNISEIQIANDGSAVANTVNYSYAKIYDQFSYFTKQKYNEQVDRMRTMIKLPNANVTKLSFVEDKSEIPFITVSFDWNSSSYGTKTGKRIFVPINTLRSSVYRFTKKERKYDIELLDGFKDEDIFTILIPEDMEIETIPSSEHFSSVFGEFTSEIKSAKNKVSIRQTLIRKSGRWKSTDYGEMIAFFEKVNAAYRSRIVLIEKR